MMQNFCVDATIFFFKSDFFAHENMKKLPSKVVWIFFLSAAPTAQKSPELKIHIMNVAQDTSVYYSVVIALKG